MDKIRWAICDDAEYICFSYKMELADYDEFEFAGNINSAKSCCQFLRDNDIDILLLDIQMENETSGIDLVPQIKEEFPDIKIIILTSYKDENYIFSAFANGADDFFLKTYPTEDLVKTMISVYENNNTLRSEIAKILTAKTQAVHNGQKSLLFTLKIMTRLSSTEFDVLHALCKGYTYLEIADQRYVSLNTIKSQASSILKKFKCHSMKELISNINELNAFSLFD